MQQSWADPANNIYASKRTNSTEYSPNCKATIHKTKFTNIHRALTISFGSSLQRPQEQFALCTVETHYCGAKPRKLLNFNIF